MPAPDVSVLVLGTYHMSNPRLDLVKTDIRDTLGSERQAEIRALIQGVSAFQPTKIMVEAVPPAERIGDDFGRYVAGEHQLTADEREQIGFRLAASLGHTELYPVDHLMDLDFGGMMEFAQGQGNAEFLAFMEETPPKVGDLLQELDRTYTVGEILAAQNSPEGLWFSNSFYMEFLEADDGEEFKGSNVTAAWYQRNLRIFSNMKRLAEPGDRLLVIFGVGHAKHLSDFVSQTRGWRLEDPLKYLPEPPAFKWEVGKATGE